MWMPRREARPGVLVVRDAASVHAQPAVAAAAQPRAAAAEPFPFCGAVAGAVAGAVTGAVAGAGAKRAMPGALGCVRHEVWRSARGVETWMRECVPGGGLWALMHARWCAQASAHVVLRLA